MYRNSMFSMSDICRCRRLKRIIYLCFGMVVSLGVVMLSDALKVNAAISIPSTIAQAVSSSNCYEVVDGLSYEEKVFITGDGRNVSVYILDTNYGEENSNIRIGVGLPNNATYEYGRQKYPNR